MDYHNIRSALRIGMVEIEEPQLLQRLVRREFVSGRQEAEIRKKTYDALSCLLVESGRSVAEVDALLFNARQKCPEMSLPDCSGCLLDPVCLKRMSLFQPVYRTTYY